MTEATMNKPIVETRPENAPLKLLLLDDEEDIINALKRLLRNNYEIIPFNKGDEALAYLQENHVDIIMSDMRMPKMDGAEFLAHAREIIPNAIRLLLTGYSDMDSTVKAINDGGVYTYISKPWNNQDLKLTLEKASDHYLLKKEAKRLNEEVAKANKELEIFNQSLELKVIQRTSALQASTKKLKNTLQTQKELFFDVLDMMSATIEYRTGFSAGHSIRIAIQCKAVAKKLELDEAQCRRIYLCALLHEIGTVGLSDDLLQENSIGSGKLEDLLITHPMIGAEILGKVKRFASLTDNILHQNENIDGTGSPAHLSGDDIPVGARIIRIVKDFDFLIAGKTNAKRMSIANAYAWMKERADVWYDRKILKTFIDLLGNREAVDGEMEFSIGVEALKPGDKLLEDLILNNGNVMLKAGQEINSVMITKLKEYERRHNTKVTLFIA
ncbi:HD domain-containing phosphohydrolase [Pseudocolwellia sp. AS88]|uniref:HD domain-containing phosphohydrolase n=1 Tax=Pseudocolwellia sp. AS88 TaxID=3063958 RepID=UPI0026EF2D4D|nr:HD domain-containing phosphohydrolase [Pseudocolwellia sp. AS88]MDO7083962.1 response regulator [Pseudocolwellia sp. AS88]